MKQFIKTILEKIIYILYFIFGKGFRYFNKLRNVLFSLWIKNVFNSCGKNFNIASVKIKGGKYINIGDNFSGINDLRFECWDSFLDEKFEPALKIGNFVSMNNNIHIGCINDVTIGNNVLFASNVFITDHFHGYVDKRDIDIPPHMRSLYSKGPVKIEDDVWIGENVTIMPNVTIGKGCVIGANSVVTRSFPEYSVVAGVPARLIKKLFD
ncbi:acyltransferase [Chryseobacterium rhizosphaerae]|uniref:acyltransferase n=1 Tax=Chryseobacterium rhizosphaerae TaxID=395937 RepID=UPI00235A4185|nr:acyltransferase [Chryseobacterium rhizosphaerae]MDC8098917.1 acyltransferase [Chryseobacterium rhizosphaerae]